MLMEIDDFAFFGIRIFVLGAAKHRTEMTSNISVRKITIFIFL
jgi:hypothetical protein